MPIGIRAGRKIILALSAIGFAAVLLCGAGEPSELLKSGATTVSGSERDEVRVTIEGESASIENGSLRWNYTLRDHRCATRSIENRRTGRELAIGGADFALEFADGTRMVAPALIFDRASEEARENGAKALVIELSGGGVRARLITEMRPGAWWATRRLEIDASAAEPAAVTLADWRCEGAQGPAGPGATVDTLGYPSGCGQPLYADDLFFGVAHPGAENLIKDGMLQCGLPVYRRPGDTGLLVTREFVVGAGESGDARRAFLRYIDATRAVPARMIILVNDWYWKDKSRPTAAIEALAAVKRATGVPVDSFTLDDGWDRDWDAASGLWGRLHRARFPGGWASLVGAGQDAGINVSLWFGPIGGYGKRDQRVAFGRKVGFETYRDKLCLAGDRYRRHAIAAFSRWAERGMDYIKVDGFWPECVEKDHGHPTGRAGAIAQMDALIEVFAAWHKARPKLVIGYTSGSNPSPFWLQHADFVWRSGADDSHEGPGEPFDRHNTFLDGCLQNLRATALPVSAIVTFDLVQHRIAGNSAAGFERGAWWLAARTSLHHDWYVQAQDLTHEQWRVLARVTDWAKRHEGAFRFSRMIGGNPRAGEIYGFAAFDGRSGTLALRNPSEAARTLEGSLAEWLDLPETARGGECTVRGVYGATQAIEGAHAATARLKIELPPFAIAVAEVEAAGR